MARKEIIGIVDAGGRGAAVIDLYSRKSNVSKFLAFPGNDLMKESSSLQVIPFPKIGLTDRESIVKACLEHGVTRLEVCQDNAVNVGVVNSAREAGILTIGHTKQAGIIESDKAWTRRFLDRIGLSHVQPRYKICTSTIEGFEYINTLPEQPLFIKAAGLAEGKGALGAKTKDEALTKICELRRMFPQAAQTYLIEDWLTNDDGTPGEEFSYFAFCNGKDWVFEGVAQDHKRSHNYDEGENTGGMGCYSNPSIFTSEIDEQTRYILNSIVPAMAGEVDEHGQSRALSGDIYLGGMIVKRGNRKVVKVVEINSRLGDPEAEVILPGMYSDRLELAEVIVGNQPLPNKIVLDNFSRIAVTVAAKGYPGDYSQAKNKRIFGLEPLLRGGSSVKVFGAGVRVSDEGHYYTAGGRLFYLVGTGRNIIDAKRHVNAALAQIYIEGNNKHVRDDIGYKEIERYYQALT